MGKHTVHVTGWDEWRATLELRCHGGTSDSCHTATDEFGENPVPIDHCNAVEWFDNCDDGDLITGSLVGEPPWPVEIEWFDDGPHIVAPAKDSKGGE